MPPNYDDIPVGAIFTKGKLARSVTEVSSDRAGRIGVTYQNQTGEIHYCSWSCFKQWIKTADRFPDFMTN